MGEVFKADNYDEIVSDADKKRIEARTEELDKINSGETVNKVVTPADSKDAASTTDKAETKD